MALSIHYAKAMFRIIGKIIENLSLNAKFLIFMTFIEIYFVRVFLCYANQWQAFIHL